MHGTGTMPTRDLVVPPITPTVPPLTGTGLESPPLKAPPLTEVPPQDTTTNTAVLNPITLLLTALKQVTEQPEVD